ncbi:MAG: hypothetical protein ACP5OU_05835 [Methanothrix sp.]
MGASENSLQGYPANWDRAKEAAVRRAEIRGTPLLSVDRLLWPPAILPEIGDPA